jgi:hypothetical protein
MKLIIILDSVEFYWILLTAENDVLKGFVDMEPYLILSFNFSTIKLRQHKKILQNYITNEFSLSHNLGR